MPVSFSFTHFLGVFFLLLPCFFCQDMVVLEILAIPQSYQGSTWSIYVVDVEFGTPPQKLNILLDGGLDMLYFFTPNCTQNGCGLNYFYPSESSSLQYTSTPLNYTYAAGNLNVVGSVVVDQGNIGGLSDPNQTFGLADQLTQPQYFPGSHFLSGVFGWAYPTEQWGALSLVNNFATQNSLPSLMSIWLPDNIYDSGVFTIGAPDPQLYTGEINYVPLLPSTFAKKDYLFFWANKMTDIKVNGVSNNYCKRKECDFFIDLAGRTMDLANAIPSIPVATDCSNLDQLDTYTFTINGHDYTLTPDQYVLRIVSNTGEVTCESGIYGGGKIHYPFTLGYTWIKNFYTVLDFDNQQFGFATAA